MIQNIIDGKREVAMLGLSARAEMLVKVYIVLVLLLAGLGFFAGYRIGHNVASLEGMKAMLEMGGNYE